MLLNDSEKPLSKQTWLNWLLHSGVSISIMLNPCHWQWRPWLNKNRDVWAGPNDCNLNMGWLMLTVRIWIDDGTW